jgi:hypothetical protein
MSVVGGPLSVSKNRVLSPEFIEEDQQDPGMGQPTSEVIKKPLRRLIDAVEILNGNDEEILLSILYEKVPNGLKDFFCEELGGI